MKFSGAKDRRKRTPEMAERDRERTFGLQLHMAFGPEYGFWGPEPPEILQYADYANFSELSLETSIDASVKAVAEEMAWKMSQTLNAMIAATADLKPPILYVYKDGSVGYTPFPPNPVPTD